MKVTLIGVKHIDEFETREGNTIEGVKLFIAYPDESTYGNMCESKYIDQKVFDNFGVDFETLVEKIGEAVDIEFNPKQKIVGVKLA